MSMADEIAKLNNLKQNGALSDEEYEAAKASLLARNEPAGGQLKHAMNALSSDPNMWGMFIHLSQFCGYLIPFAGLIVPVVLWQIMKKESDTLDRHGRIVVNWLMTELILGVVFALLCFIVIGFPLLLALVVAGIVFPIVGAVKANNGEVWQYPCSIRFFPVD